MEKEIKSDAMPKCPKCGSTDLHYDQENGGLLCNEDGCDGKIELAG